MTGRGAALALAAAFALTLLAGCSSLPFLGGDRDKRESEQADEPKPGVPLYAFSVDAPGTLGPLLETNLDLSRFRSGPEGEPIGATELDRLAAAAPAQARALLETEGYFDATVTVSRDVDPGSSLPRVVLKVVPGPRVVVRKVELDATAPIAPPTVGRNIGSEDRIERLRRSWPLREGLPFRQDAWTDAKTATLNLLRTDGYPAADWRETNARVDAAAQAATLTLVVDPGPLHRLGKVRIEGLQRYDEETVLRLASFRAGEVYSEQKLLDYQSRLLKTGLFEGATVEIDTTAVGASGTPDALPVIVRLKEQTAQQAIFGIGYSANTGPRVSVEHFDRQLFGQRLTAHSKLQYGSDLKSVGSEISTYPGVRQWRDLVAGNLEELKSADETRRSWFARVGRAQESARFDRLYALQADHSQLQNDKFSQNATAGWINTSWLRRDLDSVLLPTDGNVLAAQLGAGWGSGRQQVGSDPEERRRDPFLRTWGRAFWYRPFGSWYGNARLEVGQVFVPNRIAVPDPLLFRAGGDDSVRGYGYRTLGPRIAGEPSSGRVVATGTVEMAHVIVQSLPSVWGALFVDAGNAADGWGSYKPVLGYGAGVRWRSPVGPVKADLAYGQDVHKFRVHFSVGIAF